MNRFSTSPRLLLIGMLALAACTGQEPVGDLVIEPVSAEELMDEVRAIDSDIVVVNFWASWCLPCRAEFPEFIRFSEEADPGEAQVRFVSIDFEEDLPHAAEFLREHGISGTTFVKDGKDGPFISAIYSEWSGAIPATALYDRDGDLVGFWEGIVTYDQLAERVRTVRQSTESVSTNSTSL